MKYKIYSWYARPKDNMCEVTDYMYKKSLLGQSITGNIGENKWWDELMDLDFMKQYENNVGNTIDM